MQEPEDHRTRDATIKALTSGALSGALFGAGAKVFGSRSPAKILELMKAAGLGAGVTGGIAGGSAYVGNSLMGAPGDDEPSGYTRRGGLGGALGGGLVGAGVGALAGTGKIPMPKATPHFLTSIMDKIKKMPTKKSALLGAGLGAMAGGTAAGAVGADEGMQLDLISNEMRAAEERRMRSMYGI